jgi:hypothetical protein
MLNTGGAVFPVVPKMAISRMQNQFLFQNGTDRSSILFVICGGIQRAIIVLSIGGAHGLGSLK